MQTGENDQALRKILDMTRLISILLLGIHVYYYGYEAFNNWHLVSPFSDRILHNIYNTGIFNNFHRSKLFALAFLVISLLGAKGRKDEKLKFKTALYCMIAGMLIYFISYLFLLTSLAADNKIIGYSITTS
ncbi:conjugal transfer protein TraG, partial [Flavobacterium sp. HMWF030]